MLQGSLESILRVSSLHGTNRDVSELYAITAGEQVVRNLLGMHALFSGLAHKPIAHTREGEVVHLEGQLGIDHGSAVLANDLVIQEGLQFLVHCKNLSVQGNQ